MTGGWIKWYRQYKDCEALGHGTDWSLVGAWVAIIETARHSPTVFMGQPINRGEFGFTYRTLQSQWRKSPCKLKDIFDHFTEYGMIDIRHVGKCSVLRVVNYEQYQGATDNERYRSSNGSVTNSVTEGNERYRSGNGNGNGNGNKNKNVKNDKKTSGATSAPPVGATPPANPPGSKKDTLDAFEQFWDSYPARNGRKRDKAKARTQWGRLSQAERDNALQAVRHYADEEQFVKDAFRWLRDRSFDDWLSPAEPDRRSPVATREEIEAAGYEFGE